MCLLGGGSDQQNTDGVQHCRNREGSEAKVLETCIGTARRENIVDLRLHSTGAYYAYGRDGRRVGSGPAHEAVTVMTQPGQVLPHELQLVDLLAQQPLEPLLLHWQLV